jgi:uncharacterized membrane protein SpoIIM required for sporulation
MNLLSKLMRDLPLFFAVALLTLLLLSLIALYIPPPNEFIAELRQATEELRKITNITTASVLAMTIFLNNARVNTLLAIPFLSIVMYPAMLFSTAWVLRILLLEATNNSSALQEHLYQAVVLLLVSPHSYLEMLSYSIAFICSNKLMIALLRDLRKKEFSKETILYYLSAIILSFALLLMAAFIESYLMTVLR